MNDGVVYVFDSPNAMPRFYRDKIFTSQHQKALIIQKALEYSEENPRYAHPVEHERILKKLNKKHR